MVNAHSQILCFLMHEKRPDPHNENLWNKLVMRVSQFIFNEKSPLEFILIILVFLIFIFKAVRAAMDIATQ